MNDKTEMIRTSVSVMISGWIVVLLILLLMLILFFITWSILPRWYSSSSPSTSSPSSTSLSSSPSIRVLTPNETFQVIAGHSTFYETFFPRDWTQRNVTSYEEYMRLLQVEKTCEVYLTPPQHQRLLHASQQADRILSRMTKLPYFDGRKAAEIEWIFGMFQGRAYEFGYPHTIGEVILLPTHALDRGDQRLVRLLLHEKTHLYQKRFPEEIQLYLHHLRFRPVQTRTIDTTDIRPNPDTDNWIYEQEGGLGWYVMGVEQKLPAEKRDTNPQYYEHPFERMAIEIERSL